jgi:hypothetical protein
MPKAQVRDMTISQAAVKIFGEKSYRTLKAVQRLVLAGTFPGARKLVPELKTSPYLIPEAEVDAFIAAKNKARPGRGGLTAL